MATTGTALMASEAGRENSGILLRTVGLVGSLLFVNATLAADWKITPSLSIEERYSDNINLATSGQEESDWVTTISPGISVRREGARLKVTADYTLSGLIYANGNAGNRIDHNLNGHANAELLENWFFLDATARVSQVLESLGGGIGVDNTAGGNNLTNAASYSLSPYLKHRFGSLMDLEARVAKEGTFVGSGGNDVNSLRYTLAANSGADFFPLSWNARYDRLDSTGSSASALGSRNASGSARYHLTHEFGLLAQAGMEKNDFNGATGQLQDFSYYGLGAYWSPSRKFSMDTAYNISDTGDFWSGSVTVNPTLRTSLQASSTVRSFGRTESLNLSHRTRRSNWNLRYQEDLTTFQQQFLLFVGVVDFYLCPGGITEVVPTGAPPSDPANCVFVGSSNAFTPNLLNETTVSKNLIGTVSYSRRRNTWQLSIYGNQRDFQTTTGSDETRGVQASWNFKPGALTTYTLTGGVSRIKASTDDRNDDLWNLGLVADRQFQTKLHGSVEVRHQQRDSNVAGGDYKENSVAARVNMTF
jgi:uncharacterized protein (PEP-CTERM system associated)